MDRLFSSMRLCFEAHVVINRPKATPKTAMRRAPSHPALEIFRTHPRPFLLCFAPVVASVVAASLIHRFTWFYLFIPGLWCWFVGSFLIHGAVTGVIEDNSGKVVRTLSPKRYWLRFSLWSFGYTFAAMFPLAFALQARAVGR